MGKLGFMGFFAAVLGVATDKYRCGIAKPVASSFNASMHQTKNHFKLCVV